ncbi:hypothetical protein NEHOM01_2034 [Nematocida homosporus]|uniref:uncharacterized protein n=1 Tax=Nematocida homosporus TaxID=1912981 RepID=UPI00221F3D5C|nr:uncharacterized protein NEHOM01_2034 [Nematocida homosporus]KAI5187238.1 hypothetical protein NEHOM01_2034 [Nematocida homosporus]
MFRDIYREALKIDAPENPPMDDREERIFPNDREIDSILPECYKTAIRGTKEEKIEKFSEGTLFYVFFNHCGEKVQNEAYSRLLQLGWMFSRQMKTFVQIVKRPTNAPGLILYFDYCTWKKVTKEIVIDQEFLSTLEVSKNVIG